MQIHAFFIRNASLAYLNIISENLYYTNVIFAM